MAKFALLVALVVVGGPLLQLFSPGTAQAFPFMYLSIFMAGYAIADRLRMAGFPTLVLILASWVAWSQRSQR